MHTDPFCGFDDEALLPIQNLSFLQVFLSEITRLQSFVESA